MFHVLYNSRIAQLYLSARLLENVFIFMKLLQSIRLVNPLCHTPLWSWHCVSELTHTKFKFYCEYKSEENNSSNYCLIDNKIWKTLIANSVTVLNIKNTSIIFFLLKTFDWWSFAIVWSEELVSVLTICQSAKLLQQIISTYSRWTKVFQLSTLGIIGVDAFLVLFLIGAIKLKVARWLIVR